LSCFLDAELFEIPKDQDSPVHRGKLPDGATNRLPSFSTHQHLMRRFASTGDAAEIVERHCHRTPLLAAV